MKILVLVVLLTLFVAGCTTVPGDTTPPADIPPAANGDSPVEQTWRTITLVDVATSESFSINDFSDKTVLLESFAVWCPTCLAQQNELAKLTDEEIIHISVDTDPREKAQQVLSHRNANGFDWIFVVAPEDWSRSLVADFGISSVFAPGAPVILVCDSENARILGPGVKSPDTLREEVAKGC